MSEKHDDVDARIQAGVAEDSLTAFTNAQRVLLPRIGYHATADEVQAWNDCNNVMNARHEMFTALKALVAMYGPSTDYGDEAKAAWEMAEAALAKAEGR